MWPNPHFPADLVTFTEEILNRKLHFLCSVLSVRGNFFEKLIFNGMLKFFSENGPISSNQSGYKLGREIQ